ncbi:MAG: DUF1836 domain-containing protein [Oscillospiraceae bacterium]|nr:DUF1836 domain-containing protein [Oscillospiraceae bacterium]
MSYDKQLVAAKLRRWESFLNQYRLPAWEIIPDLGLYMDQLVSLLRQYLDYLPPELKGEESITAAAINNYVRTKIMPESVKKRYYRIHIAYLIIICTLKQGLSIALIQKLIPTGMPEEDFQALYSRFVERQVLASAFFIEQIRGVAGPILEHKDSSRFSTENPDELIISAAIIGGLSRLLAEKLIVLENRDLSNGGDLEKFSGK